MTLLASTVTPYTFACILGFPKRSWIGRSVRVSLRWLLLGISVISYLLSLTQDTFCSGGSCHGWPGWGVLVMGWLEPVSLAAVGPFVAFAWYANPLLVASWICCGPVRWRTGSICLAALACLLSSLFLLGNRVDTSEACISHEITGYAAGYWLWMFSSWLALLSAFLVRAPENRKP